MRKRPPAPERWAPIPGWPHEASTAGRIRTAGGRILAQRPGNKGYALVNLAANGEKTTLTVHSLVLAAFDGPRLPGQVVRHGPAGQADNSYPNLIYGTLAQNVYDRRVFTRRCRWRWWGQWRARRYWSQQVSWARNRAVTQGETRKKNPPTAGAPLATDCDDWPVTLSHLQGGP